MRVRLSIAVGSLTVAWAVTPIDSGAAATSPVTSSADLGQMVVDQVPVRHAGVRREPGRIRIMHRVVSRVPATVGPHGGCPAYGTVLVSGSRWLSGQGVDVVSNGGTGGDCFSLAAGHRWQCGELVNRFLATRGWSPGIAGDAGQFYSNASAADFDKHPIGSGYLPVPGDIVVWSSGAVVAGSSGGFGHVAIVVADAGGSLTVVEQNSTNSGYGVIRIDRTGNLGQAGGLQPLGYLHAKANPRASSAPVIAPPRSPKPHSAPSHHPQATGTGAARPPDPGGAKVPSSPATPVPSTPVVSATPAPAPVTTPTASPSAQPQPSIP